MASARKSGSGPSAPPPAGSATGHWREAVRQHSGFYSFLRSSYITDLLRNQAVGDSRKLARTLDKKLNYSKGHMESGRLGDTEEGRGPPTQAWVLQLRSSLCVSHTSPLHFLSICILWALEPSCFSTEGPWLPLGKVKNMTHLQQRHKIAVC